MKNLVCTLGLILLSATMFSQSKNHKLAFTVGGGFQNYKGDLGSSFKIKNDSYYGAVVANTAYYLNKSFDVGIFGSVGDYGFCQSEEKKTEIVSSDIRCPGCLGRVSLGNLNSRLYAGGAFVKYKFNNGYLLKENVKLQPYVYAGAAVNHITDRMKMNCVKPGTYYSLNAAAGVKYYVNDRINFGYQVSLGYFTKDGLDFMTHFGNDMYLQNSLVIGIDLF